MKFKKTDSKLNLAEVQSRVLAFWEKNKIFEKSVSKKSSGEVVFF
jgi:isoleucyl-tRNA synthetase